MPLCLGIETSCDETALALVEDGKLVAQRMATQAAAHNIFGGVVPELACREHLRAIDLLYKDLFQENNIHDVDVVAVARGPGLLGSLLVGMSYAKGIVLSTGTAFVGVNHLHAHLLAPLLEAEIPFPALGVLISGGHTILYNMDSPYDFILLGQTLDDAAGEAFDKAAKTLNLPYPGGRYIDKLAAMAIPDTAMFPRPYINNPGLDFSFSGIKTALVQHVQANPFLRTPKMVNSLQELGYALKDPFHMKELAKVCASFNWAVADTLRIKVERAFKTKAKKAKSLVLAGGVAANSMIRNTITQTAKRLNLTCVLPKPDLCTDNAAMIALTGELYFKKGLVHDLNLDAIPRGRKIPWDFKPK